MATFKDLNYCLYLSLDDQFFSPGATGTPGEQSAPGTVVFRWGSGNAAPDEPSRLRDDILNHNDFIDFLFASDTSKNSQLCQKVFACCRGFVSFPHCFCFSFQR